MILIKPRLPERISKKLHDWVVHRFGKRAHTLSNANKKKVNLMGKLINIDNGGTLTDIWVLDGNKSYRTKTITTPYDLSKCFFEGLKKISADIYGKEDLAALLQSTDHIRYSTTQGTNALVERKGPALGLIVDTAAREWLDQSDQQAGLLKNLVGERIATLDSSQGDEAFRAALTEAVNQLSAGGASRIVVACMEGDYAATEKRVAAAMLRAFPRHLLGSVPVLYANTLCQNADPNIRVWTALLNAFLHPAMECFLYNTENELQRYKVRHPLLVYRNDGYSGRVAKTIALKTYSSGPRGGSEGALAYARHYNLGRVITVDVGGTTTDIGLVENDAIRSHRLGHVEGVKCDYALADIVSVGVGGGSIIKVVDGAIRVGPESVGGAPGPACFSMGGEEATITDALLVTGLLDPATYFGGKLNLSKDKAEAAIRRNVADPLGISVNQACQQMTKAWADLIAKGIAEFCDVDDNTVLMAFGGGGPMGIAAVAESAGVDTVLIPRLSAVFSAHGIGFSDIAHSASALVQSSSKVEDVVAGLRERVLRDMHTEGYSEDECQLEAWYESGDRLVDCSVDELPKVAGKAGEGVRIGLRAVKKIDHATLEGGSEPSPQPAQIGSNRELVDPQGASHAVPVIAVEGQQPGAEGQGPAVLEEAFWTCSVPADWHYRFTGNGDIFLKSNKGQ